jgi:hypothetical protein
LENVINVLEETSIFREEGRTEEYKEKPSALDMKKAGTSKMLVTV